jgi:STE24 endopeptidase
MMVLAPLVIMPMFNKYDPIEENALKKDIVALAEDVNYPVQKIEVCDGSKRSGHSNAF